jgi:UDP-glucose 4-epimerase
MKVLVTGGCGFIGSHLVKHLLDQGYEVDVIDKVSKNEIKGANYMIGDLLCWASAIMDFGKFLHTYDAIYHLAANVSARSTNPDEAIENILMVKPLLNYLKPNGKFYFASSCSVYGDDHPDGGFRETDELNPMANYAWSKKLGEELVQKYYPNHYIFRFGNVFGENQDNSECGIVGIIKRHKRERKALELYNDGLPYRDYIYVGELVKAFTMDIPTGVYNLGTNTGTSTQEIVDYSGVSYTDGGKRREPMAVLLNTDKIKQYGFEAKIDVIDYVKENL